MRHHKDYTLQEAHSSELPDLLTAKDLEAVLKIDVKTIYSYVQRGLIPYVRIQSNVRFLKSQIVIWIENQNHASHKLTRKRIKEEEETIRRESSARPW